MSRHVLILLAVVLCPALHAQETASAKRRREAQEFHIRAQERTGVLVPLYHYPANVQKNAAYSRLVEIRRRYETVPMWVIVNPASGPGERMDGNYTNAIDRLRGAGCVVLGYVTTSYGRRAPHMVQTEINGWLTLYPRIHGIFFDEMRNEDTDAAAVYQATLNRFAHEAGCWPTVANPGADTPARYFAANAADVFVIHEGSEWPKGNRFKSDESRAYSSYPPFTRGMLLHSQKELDRMALRTARRDVRWVYVTESMHRSNDPTSNPWDRLSSHLEALCKELSGE